MFFTIFAFQLGFVMIHVISYNGIVICVLRGLLIQILVKLYRLEDHLLFLGWRIIHNLDQWQLQFGDLALRFVDFLLINIVKFLSVLVFPF